MKAQAPILITGATGTLGRHVVPRLRAAGCDIRVLSRHSHETAPGVEFVVGDLAKDEGIEAAVEGIEIIVHCAGSTKGDGDKARHLVRAASRAGAPHVVFISVVGADRVPVSSAIDRAMFGYFEAKRDAEQAIADSGLPWTTLRATQFHDLILTTVQDARGTGPAVGRRTWDDYLSAHVGSLAMSGARGRSRSSRRGHAGGA